MKLEKENPFWRIYYLKKKHSVERNLHTFVKQAISSQLKVNLSSEAKQAIDYSVLRIGGKRIRPILTYLAHDIVGGNSPFINRLAIISELPHKGSLLEDDIDDHAEQRDKKLPTYKVFGLVTTTEAFKFLYSIPQSLIESLPIVLGDKNYLNAEYSRLADRARQGQQKDIGWSAGRYFPTPTEYLEMCEEKCAAFEYAIRIGALAGGATTSETEALIKIGNYAATSFQIMDDLLGLRVGSDDFGSDIREGKKTLPAIYTCQELNKSKRLIEILSLHSNNRSLINEAVGIMKRNGAIDKTREDALALAKKAQDMLKEKFPNSKYRKIFSSIITYGVMRND